MIGKAFAKLLKSDFGSKYLKFEEVDGEIEWHEKGVKRIVLFPMLIWFGLFFYAIGHIAQLSPARFAITSIVLSLYTTVKTTPYLIEILDMKDNVTVKREEAIKKDSFKYTMIKNAINNGEVSWKSK